MLSLSKIFNMKSLLILNLVLLLISLSSCNNRGRSSELMFSETDSTIVKTSIRFTETEKDLGKVKEGEMVSFVYELANTGKTELFIQAVRAPCGCTKTKYDKTPIRPGKKGSIEVTFDTNRRPGVQRKTITVTTNTDPSNTVLTFSCEVMPEG